MSLTRDTAIRHISAGLRVYDKDPIHVPLRTADQFEDTTACCSDHFVRRLTLAAPLPHRGQRAAQRDETGDSPDELTRPLLPLNHQQLR